jgi:hypothetical protein
MRWEIATATLDLLCLQRGGALHLAERLHSLL